MRSKKESKEESAIPMIALVMIIGIGANLLVGYLISSE